MASRTRPRSARLPAKTIRPSATTSGAAAVWPSSSQSALTRSYCCSAR